MKRKAIPLIGSAAILAVILTLAAIRTPSMRVVSVNTDNVVLEAGAQCDYNVWLNHRPDCADCRYQDGVRVISDTDFSKLVVYWAALDIGIPESGDCFCGYWHCQSGDERHVGELWGMVTGVWRVFLPLVMR